VTLARPEFLYFGLGAALLLIIGVWSHFRRRRRLAAFVGGLAAARRVSARRLERLPLASLFILALAGVALAFAGAEPRFEVAHEELPAEPVRSVVLALNVSASMQAADVPPTRLGRAVEVAHELLDALEGDRVGLLVFAGTGYPIAPPTHDHDALRFLLSGITPTIASAHDPGTLISVGIGEAMALFDDPRSDEAAAPEGDRVILVLSDGDTAEPAGAMAEVTREAREKGIRILTIGIGTEVGAEIRMPAAPFQLGGVVRGPDGNPVIARLDEDFLAAVADLGGGSYTSAGDAAALAALLQGFERPAPLPVPELPTRPWSGPGLARWLLVSAFILLLAESLLEVRLPWQTVTTLRRAL